MTEKKIYTDTKKVENQRIYNKKYAEAVNDALENLKELGVTLSTDAEIVEFLSSLDTTIARQEEKARADFDAYVSTLPKSIQGSFKFNGDGTATVIRSAHTHIRSPQMENYTRVDNGRCVFDEECEEKLVKACSIYSNNPKAEYLWQRAQEIADSLNTFEQDIKAAGCTFAAVGMWQRFIGMIEFSGEEYFANPTAIYQTNIKKRK